MTSCPSCGFKWQSDALEATAHACPKCGQGGKGEASILPMYGAMLVLVGLLTFTIGIVAWAMPAGKWLVPGGGALLVSGVALIWKGSRSAAP